MRPINRLTAFCNNAVSPVTSLYIPRLHNESWGEKARILTKNYLALIEDLEHIHDALPTFLNALDFQGLSSAGLAVFLSNGEIRTARLSHRPLPIIVQDQDPLIMPLMRDVQSIGAGWILSIDKSAPQLFFDDGFERHDFTSLLNAPKFEDIKDRRSVQDDIFFHSTSRGPSATAKFHALGTDVEGEKDKTEQAFYREIWAALDDCLPQQIEALKVVGSEGTLGQFMSWATTDRFQVERIQSGEGAEATDLHLAPKAENPRVKGETTDLATAAQDIAQGRAKLVSFPDDWTVTGILTDAATSEYSRVRTSCDLPAMMQANKQLLAALRTGADISFENQMDAGQLKILQRW